MGFFGQSTKKPVTKSQTNKKAKLNFCIYVQYFDLHKMVQVPHHSLICKFVKLTGEDAKFMYDIKDI